MTANFEHVLYPNGFVVFVPDNWTGEQALAIYEFLECLMMAVWNRYERQMIPLIISNPSEDQIELFPDEGFSIDDFSDEDSPF